jgi:hypothetical protein
VSEDFVLLREVEARRRLGDRRIRLQVLVPYGNWTGSGALRVLRMKMIEPNSPARQDESDVELVVGYEAYQP